jgi:hypothetical protein
MRIPLVTSAIAAAMIAMLPTSTSAESASTNSQVFTKLKPSEIADILKEAGYRAELVVEPNKTPRIRTGMGGWNVVIYLYGCEGDTCASIEYSCGVTKAQNYTLNLANKWNQEKRYAKAYLDTDGDMMLEYDLSFRGGVTKDTVVSASRLFDDLVSEFFNKWGK